MYDYPRLPEPLPTKWVKISHKDPAHIAQRYLYAGYGSNLDLGQMAQRCPTADIVGPGVLPATRLAFAQVATIIEDSRATCLVGVYRLDATAVAAMDRYEGLGRAYERYLVTVEMGETKVRCFTYIKKDARPWAPSKAYYDRIRAGYRTWGFDEQRVYRAAKRARDEERAWDRPKRSTAPRTHNFDTGHYPWEPLGTHVPSTIRPRDYDDRIGYDPEEASERERTAMRYERMGRLNDNRIRIDERMDLRSFTQAVRDSRQLRLPVVPWEYMTNQERTAEAGGDGKTIYTNPRNGEHWYLGPDKVWRRAK